MDINLFIRRVTSVRKELVFLLFLAIFTYFLIELFLNNYPEIFKGASKIGVFFSRISISYISAFIFYFLVVHLGKERDKDNINEIIEQRVADIITSGHSLILPMIRIENPKASYESFDMSGLGTLLSKVKKSDVCEGYTMGGKPITHVQHFEWVKRDSMKALNEIFDRYNHLDSELIKLLSRLKSSFLFEQWNFLYAHTFDETFFSMELPIHTYQIHLNDLEKYYNKHLKRVARNRSEFVGYTRFMTTRKNNSSTSIQSTQSPCHIATSYPQNRD